MPQERRNLRPPIGLLTGQNTPVSNCFCQVNLTFLAQFLENRANNNFFSNMGINKGKALGAMMLGALAVEPALAENKGPDPMVTGTVGSVSQKIENCGVFVREQRELAAENGVPMSRADTVSLLADCRGGQLEARMAEQERVIATLRDEIQVIDLDIDANHRIIDAEGRIIAQIVAINNELIIRRQLQDSITGTQAEIAQVNAEREAVLDQMEAFLRGEINKVVS